MSNVKIVKGNLFSAPANAIICHAVNCQGVWGSGIAAEFRKRCPNAYRYYAHMCNVNGVDLLGKCLLAPDDGYTVGCLFTSYDFGNQRDSVQEILSSTRKAIKDLISQNDKINPKPLTIHMCKINAGLFGVPWELTQKVLEEFPDQEFTVWELQV